MRDVRSKNIHLLGGHHNLVTLRVELFYGTKAVVVATNKVDEKVMDELLGCVVDLDACKPGKPLQLIMAKGAHGATILNRKETVDRIGDGEKIFHVRTPRHMPELLEAMHECVLSLQSTLFNHDTPVKIMIPAFVQDLMVRHLHRDRHPGHKTKATGSGYQMETLWGSEVLPSPYEDVITVFVDTAVYTKCHEIKLDQQNA